MSFEIRDSRCTCILIIELGQSDKHRLKMWRWSFSGVRELRVNFKPRLAFQQWNRGLSWRRSWRKHFSEWARCQKAIGGIYFTNKSRAQTLQPGLELDNFKQRLKSCIFKCISWLNALFFWGDWGFVKEGVETCLTIFLSSHLLSMVSIAWPRGRNKWIGYFSIIFFLVFKIM